MELTLTDAQRMIAGRLAEFPEFEAIATSPSFQEELVHILAFEQVDQQLLSIIEGEVLLILALYSPLHDLAKNIAESSGLSEGASERLADLIKTIILSPVLEVLEAYDYRRNDIREKELRGAELLPNANSSLKERLVLRPEGAPAAPVTPPQQQGNAVQPLTREELMNALATKRTMQSDIAAVRGTPAPGQGSTGPVVGYAAFKSGDNTPPANTP